MKTKYIQLEPDSVLPDILSLRPFKSVVIVEEEVTQKWQTLVSKWLVKSGCLYMMAWGKQCSSWDDSVDLANIEIHEYGDIPENHFVMTTWHENESLNEVFWYSKNNAYHPTIELQNTLILNISLENRETELLKEYSIA